MSLFNLFKKKTPSIESEKKASNSIESSVEKQPDPFVLEPREYEIGASGDKIYLNEEIEKIVIHHIDCYGLKGLTKEETELVKPFFVSLFIWYHERANTYPHSEWCERKDHELRFSQPVFRTASKVMCCECTLGYILDNCRDWYYNLDKFESFAGYIPSDIDRMAKRIKEQITELRKNKN